MNANYVEMALIRISSIVAMNANYYNVYSVIRVQLRTWTTNLQSTVVEIAAE
jgi:hypothetical protein